MTASMRQTARVWASSFGIPSNHFSMGRRGSRRGSFGGLHYDRYIGYQLPAPCPPSRQTPEQSPHLWRCYRHFHYGGGIDFRHTSQVGRVNAAYVDKTAIFVTWGVGHETFEQVSFLIDSNPRHDEQFDGVS